MEWMKKVTSLEYRRQPGTYGYKRGHNISPSRLSYNKNIGQKYGASISERVFILYGYLPVKKCTDQIIEEFAEIVEKSLK